MYTDEMHDHLVILGTVLANEFQYPEPLRTDMNKYYIKTLGDHLEEGKCGYYEHWFKEEIIVSTRADVLKANKELSNA